MIQRITALITRNFGFKLLSIAAAFVFWISVASEPDLATIVSMPVHYRNYPRNLEISSDIVSTIDVEARGTASQLRSLSDSHPAAIVDFASVHASGERTFTITGSQLNLPRGVQLIRTIPAQLRFRFEASATRMVPVQVPLSGKVPAGVEIAREDIDPPELRIAGPQSHVLDLKRLVSDPFDVSHLAGDTEEKLSVYAPDPEIRFVSPPQVTVKVQVQHSGQSER